MCTERPSFRDTHSHHTHGADTKCEEICTRRRIDRAQFHGIQPRSTDMHMRQTYPAVIEQTHQAVYGRIQPVIGQTWMGPEVLLRLSNRRATFTKHILTTNETKTKEYHKLEGIQVSSRKSERQASRKKGSRARTGDDDGRQARRSY